MILSILLHLLLAVQGVFAGTRLRYFRNMSCNDNELSDFSNNNTRADPDCHVPPRNITRAIFVDDIDSDCAIVTYSDYACSPERVRRTLADKEMCFFSKRGGLLRSWRAVCGKEMISLAAEWEAYQRTHINSQTTTPTPTSSVPATYAIKTYTSITSWTTMDDNGGTMTMYSTVKQTVSTPVMYATPTRAGAIKMSSEDGMNFAATILVVLGGIFAIIL